MESGSASEEQLQAKTDNQQINEEDGSVSRDTRKSPSSDSQKQAEKDKEQAPMFTLKPRRQYADEGQNAKFKVAFEGSSTTTVSWKRNGQLLEDGSKFKMYEENGYHFLEVCDITPEDDGTYMATVSNSAGTDSSSAELVVSESRKSRAPTRSSPAPTISSPLQSLDVVIGDRAVKLKCEVSGGKGCTVTWYHDGAEVRQGRQHRCLWNDKVASLTLTEIGKKEGGEYKCVIANSSGEAATSCVLSTREGEKFEPPVFVQELHDMEVEDGDKVEFVVEVKGSKPIQAYWLHNNHQVKEDTPGCQQRAAKDVRSLVIARARAQHGGQYVCEAYNKYGDTDTFCTLRVKEHEHVDKPGHPGFLISPKSITVSQGAPSGTFSCRVKGQPSPDVWWEHKGQQLSNDEHFKMTREGNRHSLQVLNPLQSHAGQYVCHVENSAGSVTRTCSLVVTASHSPVNVASGGKVDFRSVLKSRQKDQPQRKTETGVANKENETSSFNVSLISSRQSTVTANLTSSRESTVTATPKSSRQSTVTGSLNSSSESTVMGNFNNSRQNTVAANDTPTKGQSRDSKADSVASNDAPNQDSSSPSPFGIGVTRGSVRKNMALFERQSTPSPERSTFRTTTSTQLASPALKKREAFARSPSLQDQDSTKPTSVEQTSAPRWRSSVPQAALSTPKSSDDKTSSIQSSTTDKPGSHGDFRSVLTIQSSARLTTQKGAPTSDKKSEECDDVKPLAAGKVDFRSVLKNSRTDREFRSSALTKSHSFNQESKPDYKSVLSRRTDEDKSNALRTFQSDREFRLSALTKSHSFSSESKPDYKSVLGRKTYEDKSDVLKTSQSDKESKPDYRSVISRKTDVDKSNAGQSDTEFRSSVVTTSHSFSTESKPDYRSVLHRKTDEDKSDVLKTFRSEMESKPDYKSVLHRKTDEDKSNSPKTFTSNREFKSSALTKSHSLIQESKQDYRSVLHRKTDEDKNSAYQSGIKFKSSTVTESHSFSTESKPDYKSVLHRKTDEDKSSTPETFRSDKEFKSSAETKSHSFSTESKPDYMFVLSRKTDEDKSKQSKSIERIANEKHAHGFKNIKSMFEKPAEDVADVKVQTFSKRTSRHAPTVATDAKESVTAYNKEPTLNTHVKNTTVFNGSREPHSSVDVRNSGITADVKESAITVHLKGPDDVTHSEKPAVITLTKEPVFTRNIKKVTSTTLTTDSKLTAECSSSEKETADQSVPTESPKSTNLLPSNLTSVTEATTFKISLSSTVSDKSSPKAAVSPPSGGDTGLLADHSLDQLREEYAEGADEAQSVGNAEDLEAPQMERRLDDQRVTYGGEAILECCVVGSPHPNIIWSINDSVIKPSKFFQQSYRDTIAQLVVAEAFSEDEGEYMCTATNTAGSDSSSCYLTVEASSGAQSSRPGGQAAEEMLSTPPRILTLNPATLAVRRGQPVNFDLTFTAHPAPVVDWWRAKTRLQSDDNVSITTDDCTSKLSIAAASANDSGRYMVTVSNELGTEEQFCHLTVEDVPEPPVGKPQIQNANKDSVSVTWCGPAYDGGSAVSHYVIETKSGTDGNWTSLVEDCKNTSYNAVNLTSGASYQFRVRAVNKLGESEPSLPTDPVLLSDPQQKMEPVQMSAQDKADDKLPFAPREITLSTDRKFEDHYEYLNELGKGKFGSVYKCQEKETGKIWAAKVLKVRGKDKEAVRQEVAIMNKLAHPKLLMLWDAFEAPRTMVLVMELVGAGELFERVIREDFVLTERDCVHFVRQICRGVDYMHSQSILHLDLKPENVLCVSNDSNEIKIIDFGLARFFKPGESMQVLFGTPEFIAPEVVNYDDISFATDMWSVGVICYVLLSGLSPFLGDTDAETLANVTSGDYDFDDESFDEISADAKNFIERLLVKRKEKRYSVKQCEEHAWLAQSDDQIGSKRLSTQKLKSFLARRKWQKTGNAIRALGRMASLQRLMSSGGNHSSAGSVSSQSDTASPGPDDIASPVFTDPSSAKSTPPADRRGLQGKSQTSPASRGLTKTGSRNSNINLGSSIQEEEEDSTFTSTSKKPDGQTTPTDLSPDSSKTSDSQSKTAVNFTDRGQTPNGIPQQPKDADPAQNGHEPVLLDSSSSTISNGLASSVQQPDDTACQRQASAPPAFLKEMLDCTVFKGDIVRFDVTVNDQCEQLVWMLEDEVVEEDERHTVEHGDDGLCSLIIGHVVDDDEGEYTCKAINSRGEVSCTAELNIYRKGEL